jgi:hypothetical protein
MLRSTTVGLVSAIALGVILAAAPSAAIAGHSGGGAGGMRGGGNMGGSAIRAGNVGGGSMMAARSDFSSGRFSQRDMDHDIGRMRMGDHDHDRGHDRDHDHDRDRHDHDRFRFFPAFAFGVDSYSDVYDPDYGCFELHRVWTHAGWRLRRVWGCDSSYPLKRPRRSGVTA